MRARSAHHRLTADVLAERQRQRRLQLVVRLRLHDLAERHDLANLVRDLEADVRLARNDLDDAHADGRERAREILREVADLAALDARGAGLSSNRVTTGPGCTATTSASTPKSLSLISTSRDIASSASGE